MKQTYIEVPNEYIVELSYEDIVEAVKAHYGIDIADTADLYWCTSIGGGEHKYAGRMNANGIHDWLKFHWRETT